MIAFCSALATNIEIQNTIRENYRSKSNNNIILNQENLISINFFHLPIYDRENTMGCTHNPIFSNQGT